MKRALGASTALALVMGLVTIAFAPVASATQPDPNHRVTICHRTNSTTHPYVKITVDEASINGQTGDDNGQGDHSLDHLGPVWTPDQPNGGDWGDIIPTVYTNGAPGYWPGLNWTDNQAGMDIFNAGCKIPDEPVTTFLVLNKNIPNVLEGDETISITFTLYAIDGGNEYEVDSCTLEYGAGDTQKSCEFLDLTPGQSYVLRETDSGGFDVADPFFFTGGTPTDGTETTIDNTFGPATARACKVTDVKGTGYDASNDVFSFDLVLVADPSGRYDGVAVPGDVLETVTANGGGTPSHPHCTSFTTVLEDNVTYRIVEHDASPWESSGGGADFTPQFPADADEVFTSTFTNTFDPATAEACKSTVIVNGYGFTAAETYFKFTLYENGKGVYDVFIGGSTPSHPEHCKAFNYVLKEGKTYTIGEEAKVYMKTHDANGGVIYVEDPQAGWTFGTASCTVDGVGPVTSFTPHYLGDAGRLFSCAITNTRTFKSPLTPGYWRNHLGPITSTCGSSQGCSANGPYTNSYLPLNLGNFTVAKDAYATVRAIFANMNCNNTSVGNNAIGCLAGHLLATKLNIANNADGTCIAPTVTAADAFLVGVGYNGPLTGTLNATQTRAKAIELKSKLDRYNNGLGC